MQHLDPSMLYNAPGVEPYVFISYCHKDTQKVLPLVYQLHQANYRFWYDRGIEAGAEWANTIAERLENCGVFVAMMTRNSTVSESCLDEIATAKDNRKDTIVIYLEPRDEVKLEGGTKMRIRRHQHLFREDFDTDEALMQELLRASMMQQCRKSAEKPTVPKVQEPQPAPTVQEPPQPKIIYNPEEFEIEGTTLMKCKHPNSVIAVPDGITKIERYAFVDGGLFQYWHFNSITSEILLPESATVLGEHAMENCDALQTIILPSGLKVIGKDAFCFCKKLSYLKIPQGIQYIGYHAFLSCSNLTIWMSRNTAPALLTPEAIREWNPDNRPIEFYD